MSPSKQTEIDALNALVQTIKSPDAYLGVLVTHRDLIASNIRNDFPAFSEVFVSKGGYEALRQSLYAAQDEIAELKKHDIRELRRARAQAEKAAVEARAAAHAAAQLADAADKALAEANRALAQ